MVVSKINKKINYIEKKGISEDDFNKEVPLFKNRFFGIDVIIALGGINDDKFKKYNVAFSPIYLVVDESEKIYQLGLYEFEANKYSTLLDNSKFQDLDINLLDKPLLFSFVDKNYIQELINNTPLLSDIDSDSDSENDDDIEDTKSNKYVKNPNNTTSELEIIDDDDLHRDGETKKEDKKIRGRYKKEPMNNWIQNFMENPNYDIKNNDGAGDCLFLTIEQAFESIKKNVTVKQQREQISINTSQEEFINYKELFEMYDKQITESSNLKNKIKKEFDECKAKLSKLKKKAKKETDYKIQQEKIAEAEDFKKRCLEFKTEYNKHKKYANDATNLIKEVSWMKKIKSLDDLKKFKKTSKFWADSASINMLELIYKIKIIVLDNQAYKEKRTNNILSCGDMVLKQIEDKKEFKPKYYIIVSRSEDPSHFQIVSYRKNFIYRFHELPFGIVELIVNKCLSSTGKNTYRYIPKFKKLIGTPLENSKEDNIDDDNEPSIVATKNDDDDDSPEITSEDKKNDISEKLFDEEVVFVFHSGSKHDKPGQNEKIGEKIPDSRKDDFKELHKIKNWRKELSNFAHSEFELNNVNGEKRKWYSVEHYFHARKFDKHPEFAEKFTLNSKSEICKDPKLAKSAGGKTGRVFGKKYRPNNVEMEEEFYTSGKAEEIMEKAQRAKYTQNEKSKKVLLLTKDAKLLHYVKQRGVKKENMKPPMPFHDVMRIRKELKNN